MKSVSRAAGLPRRCQVPGPSETRTHISAPARAFLDSGLIEREAAYLCIPAAFARFRLPAGGQSASAADPPVSLPEKI